MSNKSNKQLFRIILICYWISSSYQCFLQKHSLNIPINDLRNREIFFRTCSEHGSFHHRNQKKIKIYSPHNMMSSNNNNNNTTNTNNKKDIKFQILDSGDNEKCESSIPDWNLLAKNEHNEQNIVNKAYKNRSLAWTRRYQKLIPYERARKCAISLGLNSKNEWDEYIQDGKKEFGPYLPTHPDQMYASEWVSWEEFLGCMRSYDETRIMVQQVLKLGDMDEYMAFVEKDTKRAEGLRIPYLPHKVYKNNGWIDEDHFFGNE